MMPNDQDAVTEIALILPVDSLPALFSKENGLDAVISELERRAREVPRDITTKAGRKVIASTAYDVAKAKNELDRRGKELNEEAARKIAVTNKERKRYWDRLEALQFEIRKPLDAWEAGEAERVKYLQERLTCFSLGDVTRDSATETIRVRFQEIEQYVVNDTWEEFEPLAAEAKSGALAELGVALSFAVDREAKEAEIQKLREDAARRDEEDRQRTAAAAAAEADRQRLIDEQAATIKRMEDEQQASEKAEADRIEADKSRVADEAARAKQAAADEAARVERVAAEAEQLRLKQEADREAAAKAEIERLAREQKIAEDAAEAERLRLARERADEEAKANRRAADTKRRNEVKTSIVDALTAMAGKATPGAIADALMNGEIPHVTVAF